MRMFSGSKGPVKGYCVKCRKVVEMNDLEDAEFSNGKKAVKGTCPVCGKTLYRIKPESREGMW
jgi:predicted RNA-binding Zn-ribbon protein involved in translation (DUF1610 family)